MPILGPPVLNNAIIPDTGVLVALRRATESQHKGEVAALALVALGNFGPVANNLFAVNAAVRALRVVALTIEARNIALEAAVAAGL